jgi:hypothetical protein
MTRPLTTTRTRHAHNRHLTAETSGQILIDAKDKGSQQLFALVPASALTDWKVPFPTSGLLRARLVHQHMCVCVCVCVVLHKDVVQRVPEVRGSEEPACPVRGRREGREAGHGLPAPSARRARRRTQAAEPKPLLQHQVLIPPPQATNVAQHTTRTHHTYPTLSARGLISRGWGLTNVTVRCRRRSPTRRRKRRLSPRRRRRRGTKSSCTTPCADEAPPPSPSSPRCVCGVGCRVCALSDVSSSRLDHLRSR